VIDVGKHLTAGGDEGHVWTLGTWSNSAWQTCTVWQPAKGTRHSKTTCRVRNAL